jgi:hypothetical protein
MKHLFVLLTAICLTAGPVAAQEKPTSEEARKVITYYYAGQGSGALLMDHVLCQKIGQEGPDKNQCISDIDPGKIAQDQEIYLWMSFLVPTDDAADVTISFSRKGRVRQTASVKLTGATRFRTWKKIPTQKPGQWSVSVSQELADKDLDLGNFQYTVMEGAQPAPKP